MRTTKYTRVTPTICGEFVYTLKYKILFLILKEKDVFFASKKGSKSYQVLSYDRTAENVFNFNLWKFDISFTFDVEIYWL